jgi:hypothetical protein
MRMMNFVKRLLFLAAIGFVFDRAVADDMGRRKELSIELLDMMHLEERYSKIIPVLKRAMRDAMVSKNPEFEKDVNDVVDIYFKDMAARLNELKHINAEIYASHFTSEELEQLVAFYKSPVGVKLVTQSPAIAAENLEAAAKWNEAARLRLEKELNTLEEENCCKPHSGGK